MINKINDIALHVADFEKSLAFYRDKVGLTVKSTDEGFVEFDTEGVALALLDRSLVAHLTGEQAAGEQGTSSARFNFGVNADDVDAVYNELKERGVEFFKPPTDQEWGQRTAHFKDPDGNIWEIYTWKESSESN